MTERFDVEVLHVISPEEVADADLEPTLADAAEGRYVVVCRAGGVPSWIERIRAFVARDPIEAVTIVTDEPATEGEELSLVVEETDLSGVYEAVERV
ncbi:DUF7526 family protein [Halobaculum limi]|uniref:DUF7526 family protein n=1 Tax=Halobaculum limi TaxID=3031916 RepID=UPI002406BFA1|nr:hypothetical protein [Halobaculum sp. YSMS11]